MIIRARHWMDANGTLTLVKTPRGSRYQHEGGSLIKLTDEALSGSQGKRTWYPGQVITFSPYHVQLIEYFPAVGVWLASVIV